MWTNFDLIDRLYTTKRACIPHLNGVRSTSIYLVTFPLSNLNDLNLCIYIVILYTTHYIDSPIIIVFFSACVAIMKRSIDPFGFNYTHYDGRSNLTYTPIYIWNRLFPIVWASVLHNTNRITGQSDPPFCIRINRLPQVNFRFFCRKATCVRVCLCGTTWV